MSAELSKSAGTALVWKGIQIGAARLVSFFRLLILARLLVPQDFGLLAIGAGTIQMILALTDFGMVPALVQRLQLDEEDYHAAWSVNLTRALLVAVAIVAFAPLIASVYREPDATPIIRALALGPVLEATASIKTAQLMRELQFRALALMSLASVIVDAIVAVSLANALGVWALVAGSLSGALALVIASYLVAPYRPRFSLDPHRTRPLVRFGRWVFLSSVVAVAGSLALQMVISRQLGAASLGLYYLVIRMALLPSAVATEVVGSVAFPVYAQLQSDMDRSVRAFRVAFTGLTTLLVPTYALLIALAPGLEQYVLGPAWTGAAPVIRILSLVGLVGILADVVVPVLKGLGQPYKVTVLEAVQSLLIILLAGLLAARFGLVGAAAAWLPATFAAQVLAAWFIVHLLPRPLAGTGASIAAVALASLLGVAAALLGITVWPSLLGLVASATLGGVVVVGALLILDRWMHLGLVRVLAQAIPRVAHLAG